MQDEIIAYMEQKYGDELADKPEQEQPEKKQGFFSKAADIGKRMFRRKATAEDVRQIFTSILEKERTGRQRLIREMEQIITQQLLIPLLKMIGLKNWLHLGQ